MKFLTLLLFPFFSLAQCKTINPIYSLSCGYQNGFSVAIEAGFWQVDKPLQASIGAMAYNVSVVNSGVDKDISYRQPIIDPYVRAGFKFKNTGSLIIVPSAFASLHGVLGLTSRLFYQIGPVTLAGIEFGATNKGLIAKSEIIFAF